MENGLKHLRGHTLLEDPEGSLALSLNLIEVGVGSRTGCISNVRRIHEARSVYAWFAEHDLFAVKNHAYIATKLRYITDVEGPLLFVQKTISGFYLVIAPI